MSGEATCIRLWDCLLVPLQGEVSDLHAEAVVSEVLGRVRDEGCRNVILELSGVGTLDSHLCASLVNLARAARMMGAETVVAGMRPEIAMTLEAMGVRLKGMVTVATLEDAVEQLGIRRSASEKDDALARDDGFLEQLLGVHATPATPENDLFKEGLSNE